MNMPLLPVRPPGRLKRIPMTFRVMIIEDHDDFREGLLGILRDARGFRCVGSHPSVEDALKDLPPADVALMDIGLPGKSGIEGAYLLRTRLPQIQIVMLTVFEDDRHVFEAIMAGANGYILKKTPPLKILESIREAASGGMPMTPVIARHVVAMFRQSSQIPGEKAVLTPREQEILALLVEGLNYGMIGERLFISLDTVRNHIRHIYEKLHVHSKSAAVVKAIRNKIV